MGEKEGIKKYTAALGRATSAKNRERIKEGN
jgi:hypothetical protein